jgi:hypothetical protein
VASNANDARAGGAFVELYAKDTTANTMKDLEARLKKMAVTVGIIGAAMAAAGAAMTAPFLRGLNVAAEWGSEIIAANRRTGVSFQGLQTLTFALGTDMNGLAVAVRTMDGLLEAAINEPAGQAAQRIDALGLSVEALQRATQDNRVRAFAGALGRLNDEGLRIAHAQRIFGEQGAALNLRGGAAGIADRERRAQTVGAVMSDADIEKIRLYNRAMTELGLVTRAIWASLGMMITPQITAVVTGITSVINRVRLWMNENRGLVTLLFYLGTALTAIGTLVTVLGTVFWVAGGAFTAFRTVAASVWAVVTSLGGALAIIQYGAMIVGLGTVSTVALGARAALYSYKLVVGAATAATWAYNFALGVYEGLMGTMTVATAAATGAIGLARGVMIGNAITTYSVAIATGVYNAALWALTTGFGVLTIVQGVASIGAAAWLWLTSSSAITTWLFNAAAVALVGTLTVLAAIYNFVTVSLWNMTVAEIAAWIWEVILTEGTALLTAAFHFLFGSIVIVTGALSVLAGGLATVAIGIGLLGVRFGALHQSLAWIDDVVDFVASIPSKILAAWNYLADVVTYVVRAVVGALAWMRDAVASVWTGINDLIDAFDSDALDGFMSVFAYAAIGLMIFIPLWDYMLTQFLTFENVSNATTRYLEMMQQGFIALGTAVLDYFLAPFRFAASAIQGIIAGIHATIDAWVAYLHSLVTQIIAPFIRVRDMIVDAFASAISFVRAQFERLVAVVNGIIDRFLGPLAYLRDRILDYFAGLVQRIGDYFNGVTMALQGMYLAIVNAFGNAVDGVRQLWSDLVAWFRSLFSGRLIAIIRQAWLVLVSVARNAVAAVQALLASIGDALLAPFRILRDFISSQIGLAIEALFGIYIAVVNEMVQVAMTFWDAWVRLGQSAVIAFMNIARGLRDAFAGVWEAFASGFRQTMNGVITTAMEASQAIWGAISSTFSRLMADARRVWDGIRRAFNAGEWQLLWDIAKAAASLGWLEIKQLGQEVWVEVKYAAMSAFDEIVGYLSDAFDGAWLALRKGFNTVLGEVKALWSVATGEITAQMFELAARNPLQSSAQRQQLRDLAADARETGRVGAGQARQRAEIDNRNLTRAAAGESIDRQAARVQNEMDIEAARAREREAVRSGNGPAIQAARDALNALLARAASLPQTGPHGQGAGSFDPMGGRGNVVGTFSAAAAMGFVGANIEQEQLAELREIGQILEQQVALAMNMLAVLSGGRDVSDVNLGPLDGAALGFAGALGGRPAAIAGVGQNAFPPPANPGGDDTFQRNMLQVLGTIRDYLRDIRNRPGIQG